MSISKSGRARHTKGKDRGRVKLQPKPGQSRLKRGDDELFGALFNKTAKKRDRGGVKSQPREKQSGVKRGDEVRGAATARPAAKKKDRRPKLHPKPPQSRIKRGGKQ